MSARVAAAVVAAVGLLSGCPRIGPECSAGQSACGTACVDLQADSRHCGACGATCGTNEACVEGGCACRQGASACPGAGCVDLRTDPGHCGACGRPCPTGYACASSGCVISCQSYGLTQCGASCVDLASDSQHCGACDRTCTAGGCVAGGCDPSWSSVVASASRLPSKPR